MDDEDVYKLMLAWTPAYQADPDKALIRLEYMSGRISQDQAVRASLGLASLTGGSFGCAATFYGSLSGVV
jgi:hypothetical protein